MAPSTRWPDPRQPQANPEGSVFIGPLTVPDLPRKRRWGWLLLWTFLVFAGGVAAGPTLTNQAFALVERASSMLGMEPPQLVEKLKPAKPSIEPLPAPGVEQAPVGEARAELPPTTPEPVARQAEEPAESEKPAGTMAQQPAARSETAAPTAPARPAVAEMAVARPAHTTGNAKTMSRRAATTMKGTKAETPAPADAPFHDPFADGAERANRPKAAVPSRKSNPSFDEPARTAKNEPAAKPAASPSQDSLDNLMADVTTDRKGKDKPHQDKSLDALLNDVQKGKPDSPPKHDAPASLPPLSQSDITRVMAEVKTRGKECARQLGQKGIAELNLVVGKEGRVTQVSVGGNVANTPLAACIEKAVRAASFPRSAGLRFDYRIDVR
ncbi:MAG TPA: hypothetical protein VJ860_04845 [Polyangia bacterium]|nr:hypothetical protein [Polyangia bacterium]